MRQQGEAESCFSGDGEMSRLMRAHDWSATPLGPAENWPQSLKIVVRILLGSRYAMWLGWGPEFTFFYNDAYAAMTLGAKHPWALGRPARDVWPEIWEDVGPRAESVVRTGKATWDERLLLFLQRRGFPEETYHTFSYSPVPGDSGGVGGMLCVVTEDTERAIGERRLKTLRELAARTTEQAKSAEDACQAAALALAGNPHDLPFVLLYLVDADARAARLAGATGLTPGTDAAPPEVGLLAPAAPNAGWPLRAVLQTGRAEAVTDIGRWLGPHEVGVYPEPPHTAAVLPLRKPGQGALAGFLVAGVSPRRPFDDDYRGFLDLLAGQTATAIANARAYQEERRRAESLAELDRAKTAFFQSVSHEFRTPLTLLLGPVEDALAETDGALHPVQRERLGVVHRNGLRLKKLVNTLLDFSRIEAGRARASYEPADLATFTAELASCFRSACERAGLELAVDCPPLPEPVYVDREMWEKIVLNLVSNAFKFTLAGRIAVSLRQEGRAVELAVRDTGTGIPADQVPRLFERFHRVEGARGRTQEGSGIGLALVRELARLHGGDVRAESRLGEGSCFRVTVPLGTAHLPPDHIKGPGPQGPAGLGASPYVQEALRWLPDSAERPGQPLPDAADAADAARPVAGGGRPRILLADDNADMRDYIRRLLAGHYEVVAVADGLAALEAARRQPPDLLLSDVMMPGLDGFGLLRELRECPRTQGLPVILLSARAGEEARVEGLQAGADDYLTKPFSARELLARIASALEIARLRREALDQQRRLLAEVQQQRNWLRVTLASIGDAVIATDNAGRAMFLNPVAEALTGWREEEARGRPLDEIFVISNEATRQPAESPVAAVLREGRMVGLANHTVLTARDGTERPIDDSAAPIKAEDGPTLGVVLIFRDVTERRRAEQEISRLNRDLQRRVAEFQALLDVIPIGIAVAEDPACRRIWSNPAMARLLHLDVGTNVSLSAPAEERPAFRVFEKGRELAPHELPMQAAIATGREVRGAEHDLLLHDGTWVTLLNHAVPLYDEAGRPRGGLYAGVDVTEQERSRRALREAERRFRAAFNQQFQFMAILGPDGTVLEANDTCFRATGVQREQAVGRPFWETPWWDRLPAMQQRLREAIAEALRTGGPVTREVDYSMADGAVRHATVVVTGMTDEDGRVTTLIVEGRDDTDRKLAEAALRQSERRLRQLADAMPQIVWTAGPDGHIDYLNRRWTEFTGLPQTVGNAGWGGLLHPDDAKPAGERWAACVASGAPFEMGLRLLGRREHCYRWHLVRTVAVRDGDGKVARWFGTATDIHEQKRAEQASRFLAEASAELAGVVDLESTLQKVANLAVPYFADWSAVDLAAEGGELRRLAVAHQSAEKIALVRELMREYPPDPRSTVGAYAVLRTGRPELVGEITDEMLAGQARDERHLRLVRSLGLKSYICVPLVVSGNTLGLLTFATAESGRRYAESDLALATDLAHRAAIAIENTRLYEALRETDRRKDEFLATLAHELRNPLAPIRNSLQILKMPRLDAAAVERTREMMERQVQHLVRLVDDLLDVSRVMRGKITLHRERVELASAVARAVETAQPLIEAQGHELTVALPDEPLPLEADPVRLAQVVGNLLTNAAKYTEPGGRIWVTGERDGGLAVLRVRDSGIGIAPGLLPRVFDLFVQADHAAARSQGGLGIGLTLVKNLVEMHNGAVEARSDGLGRGSEFVVRLPLAEWAPGLGREGEAPGAQAPSPSGHRLLVVDDNQDAADSLALLLRLQGHEVRVAYSGVAALEMARASKPDAVFLDIGMPGMDGYEVARRLRQQPGLENVVLAALTGWGQQEDRRRSAEAGFNHHLVKPPEPEAVAGVLAEPKRG